MTYVLAANDRGPLAELHVDASGRGRLTTRAPAFSPQAGQTTVHRLPRGLTARLVAEIERGADRDSLPDELWHAAIACQVI